ncbi:hypothetical protein D3C84_962580 [compost metagenome]
MRVIQRIRPHELVWALMKKAHLNQLLLSRVHKVLSVVRDAVRHDTEFVAVQQKP